MPDVSNLTLSGARPGQGQTNEVGNFQMSLLGHFTPPATRLAALGDQLGQLAHDTVPGDRGVRHSRQALSGHIIDHVEHPEPPAGCHLVVHEVQAPALVRQRQNRSRRSCADSTLAASSSPEYLDLLEQKASLYIAEEGWAEPALWQRGCSSSSA